MAAKLAATFFPILLFFSISIATTSAKRTKLVNIIKEVNRKGQYFGLITVYPPEENAFFSTGAFKPDRKHPFVDLSGRRFRIGKVAGKKVIYVRCGVGMVNAAAATQQMLDVFDIIGIIHFGIAGNVNNSMSIGDVTIPKQFAHTGIWDWLNPNGSFPANDVAHLDFGNYNVPWHDGMNKLGHIGFSYEQFFSDSAEPDTATPMFWLKISQNWLQLATNLEGMELEGCVNSTLCLPQKPKLVAGLKASTANIFVDNAAYREFLYETFEVSSVDMESAAVVMTSLSNGYPVIVMRGLSDIAGGQTGKNVIETFGPLAALNAAKAVVLFISRISQNAY